MKKAIKLLVIILVISMLMPFTAVNATSTKIEEVLEKFNSSASLKNINGKAIYNNDMIEIEYTITNTNMNDISFPCEDNVIEYIPGEITNYDEAEDVIAHTLYATQLIYSALKLNGYTQEEINNFFELKANDLDYEINGIEIKKIGNEKTFTGGQYNTTITLTPISIKVNVAKANLKTSSNDEINLTETTIEDVIDSLKSDEDFTSNKDENGRIIYKNEITYEDNSIKIENIYYSYDYHNIYFTCEDGILTYETGEITNFYEAEETLEYEMWAHALINYALQANGYTQEQVYEYLESEDNKLDFETNGIEYKIIGEEKTFTGGPYDITTTVAPISIKIDFERANIDVANIETASKEYKVLEGAEQKYKIGESKNLTFRFDIDYDTFKTYGEIWLDEKRIEEDNYTSKSGSTVITFNDEFINTLSEGEHHLEIPLAQGRLGIAKTNFYIEKANTISENKTAETTESTENTKKSELVTTSNPKTGDNIILYVVMAVISVAMIVALAVLIRRK